MCAHARPWPPFQLVQVAVLFLNYLLDSMSPTQVHACLRRLAAAIQRCNKRDARPRWINKVKTLQVT